MRRLVAEAKLLAAHDAPVFITGESGTGKELIADLLHAHNARGQAGKPLVKVNCAALPRELVESELFGAKAGAYTGARADRPGLFVAADGGTLFLDELTEMPIEVQPKLLRTLQDGRVQAVGATEPVSVNVRVIAATNRPLGQAVEENRLRPDLYYRLAVLELGIPPLRDRPDDIGVIARHFLTILARPAAAPTLTPDALSRLVGYDWPGNVRELQAVLTRTFLLNPGATALDAGCLRWLGPESAVERAERKWSRERLLRAAARGKSVMGTAAVLGVSRAWVHSLMKSHGLTRADLFPTKKVARVET